MKTLNFNKKSWHYKLAKFGDYDEYRPDFCHYVRSVLAGLFFMLIFLAFGGVFLYCAGDFIGYVCMMIKTGLWLKLEPDLPAKVFIISMGLAAVIGLMLGSIVLRFKWQERKRAKHYANIRNPDYVEPPPSFIASAYETLKEKTCFRVNFD